MFFSSAKVLASSVFPTPVEMVTSFKEKMEAVGNRCDLILYKDQGHAFFAKKPIKYFIETTHEIDKFLVSLGYLNGNSTINNQYN